jgi:hypothetical protein
MHNLGKLLLTLSAVSWGLAPFLADWGPTHVYHVDWLPHARVHTVWLLMTGGMLAVLSFVLIWAPMLEEHSNLRIAGLIGIFVLLGFFIALALAGTYGGAISDPDHEVLVFGINRNLVILTLTLIVQVVGTVMIWKQREQ